MKVFIKQAILRFLKIIAYFLPQHRQRINFLHETAELKAAISCFVHRLFKAHSLQLLSCKRQLKDFLIGVDIVLFVPWVKVGGADKLITQYVQVLKNAGLRPKLITTIEAGDRIMEANCDFLDIGKNNILWTYIYNYDKLGIVLNSLTEAKVQAIHIINSRLLLQMMYYYYNEVKENQLKIIISYFTLDYSRELNKWLGFPIMYPESLQNADVILSDNNYWYEKFKEINKGVDFNYVKLGSPTKVVEQIVRKNRVISHKILWASRIVNSKLPDVLYQIALILPQFQFIIYGGKPDTKPEKIILEKLLQLENIDFRDEYNSLSELNFTEFDLYLYTSSYDGIPNVLLEMVNELLPVICSDVGGISEVVGKDYELLVKQPLNPLEYTEKIKLFYADIDYFNQKTQIIKNIVNSEYNESKFASNYLAIVKQLMLRG